MNAFLLPVRVSYRYALANVTMLSVYRAGFLVTMINGVVPAIVLLAVWLTVLDQGASLPYRRDQIVTYYVLLAFVIQFTTTWVGGELASSVRDGTLSPWLLRPAPYLTFHLGNHVGEKLLKLSVLLPVLAVVGFILRSDLRLTTDPVRWILFAFGLPLGFTISFLIDVVIGALAFWLQDVTGVLRLKTLVSAVLAGQVVPLALFPPSLTGFLEAQPFRYVVSFPLEILVGNLGPSAIIRGFSWEIFYCAMLWVGYRLLWARGLQTYAAYGA